MPPGKVALWCVRWLPALCVTAGLANLGSAVLQRAVWYEPEFVWILSAVAGTFFLAAGVYGFFDKRRTKILTTSTIAT